MSRSAVAFLAFVGVLWPALAAHLKGQARYAESQSDAPDTALRTDISSMSSTSKYLISSFPEISQVAYTHLPDTIWRPLYVGNVKKPMGVATDGLNQRLYVADQVQNKIFWYQLIVEGDGLLKTDGFQRVAVEGVTAHWMAVNGVGDLYFSGQKVAKPPASGYRSVFRMDASQIQAGVVMNPHEVFSRSSTGFPDPKAWMPSGVGVDSFNVYWGNQEKGQTNGAVCSGTRQNIGVTSNAQLHVLTKTVGEVRGLALTSQSVFYLGKDAVYGTDKSQWSDATSHPALGMIQSQPVTGAAWDPKSIAFDGEGTLYWTETAQGAIYQLPAMDTNPHPLLKYIDAPQVYGVSILTLTGLDRRHVVKAEQQSSAVIVEEKNGSFKRVTPTALLLAIFVACLFPGL